MTSRRLALALALAAASVPVATGPAHAQFTLGGQRAGTSSGAFLKIGAALVPQVAPAETRVIASDQMLVAIPALAFLAIFVVALMASFRRRPRLRTRP